MTQTRVQPRRGDVAALLVLFAITRGALATATWPELPVHVEACTLHTLAHADAEGDADTAAKLWPYRYRHGGMQPGIGLFAALYRLAPRHDLLWHHAVGLAVASAAFALLLLVLWRSGSRALLLFGGSLAVFAPQAFLRINVDFHAHYSELYLFVALALAAIPSASRRVGAALALGIAAALAVRWAYAAVAFVAVVALCLDGRRALAAYAAGFVAASALVWFGLGHYDADLPPHLGPTLDAWLPVQLRYPLEGIARALAGGGASAGADAAGAGTLERAFYFFSNRFLWHRQSGEYLQAAFLSFGDYDVREASWWRDGAPAWALWLLFWGALLAPAGDAPWRRGVQRFSRLGVAIYAALFVLHGQNFPRFSTYYLTPLYPIVLLQWGIGLERAFYFFRGPAARVALCAVPLLAAAGAVDFIRAARAQDEPPEIATCAWWANHILWHGFSDSDRRADPSAPVAQIFALCDSPDAGRRDFCVAALAAFYFAERPDARDGGCPRQDAMCLAGLGQSLPEEAPAPADPRAAQGHGLGCYTAAHHPCPRLEGYVEACRALGEASARCLEGMAFADPALPPPEVEPAPEHPCATLALPAWRRACAAAHAAPEGGEGDPSCAEAWRANLAPHALAPRDRLMSEVVAHRFPGEYRAFWIGRERLLGRLRCR